MNDLATTDQRSVSTQSMVFDPAVIQGMYRMAEMMASARIAIPKHLVGSPGDCLAIVMQAAQWQMSPYAVAQKTHVVNGSLGYEAQLVNAVVSSSSLLSSRIAYAYEGDWSKSPGKADKDDSRAVTVSATIKGESAPRAMRVSMAQVGDVRNSPLWASDPRQQLAYLATKKWARLHAPDVMLGVYTVDELHEIHERDMGPANVVETLNDQIKRKVEPAPDLDDVLCEIAAAETLDAIKIAAAMASKLASAEDKATARGAYAARKALLESPQSDPVSAILAGIAKHDPADLDIWLEEAREQGLSPDDVARVEVAIEERKA